MLQTCKKLDNIHRVRQRFHYVEPENLLLLTADGKQTFTSYSASGTLITFSALYYYFHF